MGILTITQNDNSKTKFEANVTMDVYSYVCGRKTPLLSLLFKQQFKVLKRVVCFME